MFLMVNFKNVVNSIPQKENQHESHVIKNPKLFSISNINYNI